MRDEVTTELEHRTSVKPGAWNAYDVWKTTIHTPRGERSRHGSGSLGDYLDEEEERLRQRVRKLRRVIAVLLLVVASGIGLLADHYLSATHAQPDRLAVIAADN